MCKIMRVEFRGDRLGRKGEKKPHREEEMEAAVLGVYLL